MSIRWAKASGAPSDGTIPLIRAALALAGLKVAVGLGVAPLAPSLLRPVGDARVPATVGLVVLAVFGLAAVWLLIVGRDDRRSTYLALAFFLIAASFSEGAVAAALAGDLSPALAKALALLNTLEVGALLPLSLWLFARDFPRTAWFGVADRAARSMAWVSGVVGATLITANLLPALGVRAGALDLLQRSQYGIFWVVVFLLTLPVFPFMIWKARLADVEERRRVRLFNAGLLLGMGPMFTEVVLHTLVPPFGRFVEQPSRFMVIGGVLYVLILSIPFTTAYSVLVHRVLDVRLLVRRALQYLLARYSVIALATVPLVALALYVYRQRERPVGELFAGGQGLLLLATSVLALVAIRVRGPLLELIDRRFFRDQYDAREILADLVRNSRTAAAPQQLAEQLETEIDRALHLESIAVLRHDTVAGTLVSVDHHVRSLPVDSALATIAAGSPEPLEIDLEASSSALARLPEKDRQWVADGGFELLVPLLASSGALLALIALGAKKSELPFSVEDRSLLVDIAASGSLALENLVMLSSAGLRESADGVARPHAGDADEGLAVECSRCQRVYAPGSSACETCKRPLARAPVPYVVAGKFRLDRRLGAGGMGVVYRGSDLVLGRHVAIKTLPRLSPERSLRMRREARAMAAVSHANLALIFGAESWRGTPILVFELLEGGTLLRRLRGGRLDIEEALDLGIALAGAVEALHRAGILHRDIKPSNIGFTREGQSKLLDFGLARMLDEEVDGREVGRGGGVPPEEAAGETLTMTMKTAVGKLVGTPLYMSPEATRGAAPDPSFDLWGLSMVLYEALSGAHPFRGGGLQQCRQWVLEGEIPDLARLRPDCPLPLAAFFERGLHRSAAQRPGSARELRSQLEELRRSLTEAA